MTDPIEQARGGFENAIMLAEEAIKDIEPSSLIDAALDHADAVFVELTQAILRYHPDVVRLVEAARRFDYAPDEVPNQDEQGGCVFCGGTPPGEPYGYTESADDHESDCAWLVLHAALVPFTTEEESE